MLPLSIEFELLLELLHPTPDCWQSGALSKIQHPRFDPSKFLQMVKWHRVTPQVYQQLSSVRDDMPDTLFRPLQAMNTRCRMKSLKLSSWLARISRKLKEQHIDFIAMKGIALSQLLYADKSYREIRDIDILIERKQVESVESMLLGFGFVHSMSYAGATVKQVHYLNQHRKDREYYHSQDGTLLELHWRLIEAAHPFNPTLHQLLAEKSSVRIHGEQVNTISGSNLWLYQCLHGSVSGWYRMRWISDIGLLLTTHQPDWDELLERADQYQCRNSLLEAVGLACALFMLPVPDPVQPLIERSRQVQQNINYSAERLFYMQLDPGLAAVWRIRFWASSKTLLKYLLVHIPITPGDFQRVALPDQLFFVYYLIRPFSFLYRHIHLLHRKTHR